MKRARRIARPAVILSAVFLALIGAAAILFYSGVGPIDIEPASRDLDSEAAAYRLAGWPWTAAEVDNRASIKGQEKGTVLLEKAMESIPDVTLKQITPHVLQLAQEEDYVGLERAISPFFKTLALASQAAAEPSVKFWHDWDFGPNVFFPEFVKEKALARLFVWRAMGEAKRGDAAHACRDLAYAQRIADFAGDEPDLISGLVEIACDDMVLKAFNTCGALLHDNANAIRQLQACLQPAQEIDLTYHMRVEAYIPLAVLRNSDQYGGSRTLLAGFQNARDGAADDSKPAPIPTDPSKLKRNGLPGDLMSRALLDKSLGFWVQTAALIRQHPHDADAVTHGMGRITSQDAGRPTLSNALNLVLDPVYEESAPYFEQDLAYQIVTHAFLAAMLYHAETGRFPSRISDLRGSWIDPFSRQPLRIRNSNGGFRIYALGESGRDLGGRARSEMLQSNADKGVESTGHEDDYNLVLAYPPLKGGL